jgi:RimJ/RimL family protein N-acetyltransferase
MEIPDPWPLDGLVLRTPRLELRPDDDAGLRELVDVAYGGVHPPGEMPFHVPWTDADPRYLGRGIMQHYWRERSVLAPEAWSINFLVRVDGRVIGVQGVYATHFEVLREVTSGSWIGMAHQRHGYGTEMRAAVLMFAFDHLGALRARTSARAENAASRAVSRKLGYREDGTMAVERRGVPTTDTRFVLDRAGFQRPPWQLAVDGLAPCAGLLAATSHTE